MRAPFIIALSLVGIFAGTAAAADLPYRSANAYPGVGAPAQPLVLYRYEPGVTIRAYWQAPWGDRHYYPHSNRLPRLGRSENMSAPRRQAPLAAAFARSWSNAADLRCDCDKPSLRQRPPARNDQFPPAPQTPNS